MSKIRDALIGKAKKFKTKAVDIDGTVVEIKEPSYKQRSKIITQSTVNGEIDSTEFLVNSVMALTFEPGTDIPVFQKEDKDTLLGMPVSGGFMTTLSEAVGEVLGGDGEPEKN